MLERFQMQIIHIKSEQQWKLLQLNAVYREVQVITSKHSGNQLLKVFWNVLQNVR